MSSSAVRIHIPGNICDHRRCIAKSYVIVITKCRANAKLTLITAWCRITTLELCSCRTWKDKMQKGLQECWRSAQRWRTTLISANNRIGDAAAKRLADRIREDEDDRAED
jgi:hypothetical protein